MQIRQTTLASATLGEIDAIVYGTAGTPVAVLPTYDSSCACWEAVGMVDALADLIEAGTLRLVCLDSADDRGLYATSAPLAYRAENADAYLRFLTKELPAALPGLVGEKKCVLAGCEAGATNALAAVLRRPAAFTGALLMSGIYDLRTLSAGEADDAWLACSPHDLAARLSPRAQASLAKLQLALVCAVDPAEATSQHQAEDALRAAGADPTCEYWDDAPRGWDLWREMACQLLPAVARPGGLADRRADQHAARVRQAQERLTDAQRALDEALEAEEAARERVSAEERSVGECAEAHRAATAVAQGAWDARNEAAAKLAALDNRAQRLQAEADAAAAALSDARWFAGEAASALAAASASRSAADAAVASARDALDALAALAS